MPCFRNTYVIYMIPNSCHVYFTKEYKAKIDGIAVLVLPRMIASTVFGILATCCTTFANIPQILHIRRNRSAKDVSLITFSVLVVGIMMWFMYGVLEGDQLIITAQVISFILTSIVLGQKFYYDPPPWMKNSTFSEMGLISSSTIVGTSTPQSTGLVRINVRSPPENSSLV